MCGGDERAPESGKSALEGGERVPEDGEGLPTGDDKEAAGDVVSERTDCEVSIKDGVCRTDRREGKEASGQKLISNTEKCMSKR